MSFKYITRSKKKQSLSDQLDIGAGRYVHNVQFTSSKATEEHVLYEDRSLSLASRPNSDWPESSNTKTGHYVYNLEFPPIVDLTSDQSYTCNAKLSSDGVSLGTKSVSCNHETTGIPIDSPSDVHVSSTAKGSLTQSDRPNFTKLHAEYKEEWRRNPPPNESRPMRLFEFIWSHCDGKTNKYNIDYGSDNSLEKKLKESEEKRGKPLREIFADMDAKDESKRKAMEDEICNEKDYSEEKSLRSTLSNQSLVDFFSCRDHDNVDINVNKSDNSSLSSGDVDNSKPSSLPFDKCNQITLAVPCSTRTNSISNVLHIPDGFSEIYYNSDADNEKVKKLNQFKFYVTDSLLEEMSKLYPKSGDFISDDLSNDVVMDKNKFSSNFTKMFPKDRIFINYLQLRQAVSEFFKHWNLLCKSNGKSLRCSYSHTPAKKKVISDSNIIGGDTNRQSTASVVKCPFHIKWTLLDHKRPYRHDIFYRVKISSIVSTEHTCMMSNLSYRHALRKSTGHNKIDLKNMNTAVSVLKMNPSMPTQMLRPLLKDSLPSHTNIDGKFVDNFRRRVAIYHAKNPNHEILTMEECKALSQHKDLTQGDFIGMNDPLVRANLNNMYGKIMENDNKVWSALQFLIECKKTINGFDYRILRGTAGNPTALLYMTSRMRYNLIRYGNIMFIDGQKRKYNRLNWPYIGPVIKNSDNRIGVTCEAIVTTEDIDTYTWIFKSMVSIEPRWSFSKLQILYGDGLVTKKLLLNLGISDTCILHGDFYHLFKENWPKPENFGIVAFRLVKPYLFKMLLSKTETEWDLAFQEASQKLTAYPTKLELLKKIHGNPSYYAGYVTRKVVGNLSLNGTAPSEQNHSSIVAFNGETMLGSICDHLKSLCERQQQICNKENDFETEHLIRLNHFKPTLDGEFAYEEIQAMKALSIAPHKNYFVKQLKSSEGLQISFNDSNQCYQVWPAGESFDHDNDDHVIIKRGGRCKCWRRVDFDIQCKHELRIQPKFKIGDWGHRWYNRREFNKHYPNMSTFEVNPEIINIDDTQHDVECNNSNVTGSAIPPKFEDSESGNEVIYLETRKMDESVEDKAVNSIIENDKSKVSYSDVLELATDLCRTVSGNPPLCKITYGYLFEWISKLRQGEDFDVIFSNKGLPKESTTTTRNQPFAAVVTPPGGMVTKKRNRYKSSEELRRRNFKYQRKEECDNDTCDIMSPNLKECGKVTKSKNHNIDEYYVGAGMQERKYCFLCRQPKCTRWNCKVLQCYEKVPGRILPKGHQESRDKLISLISTVDNHVICHNRSNEDKRIIYHQFPSKIKALIVHKKYIIEDNSSHISPHENVCIECTLLGDLGVPIENYSGVLFTKNSVIRHIARSRNNLVVDNLS